jgi:predicted secreted protein with PEFG-CTERM motif
MKTKAISSFFVLFAIASVIATTTPDAFADHTEVTITTTDGSAFGQDCVAEGCYMPSVATVDVGEKVIFSNTDASLHTFTAGTVEGFTQSPTGEFNVITMEQGETGEWTPEEVGEVPYYCSFHVWMVGTIIVQEVEDANDDTMEDTHDEDVELMLTITDSQVLDGTQVELEFSELHVNYEITATQNGEEVFKEAAHAMEHTATHQIDAVGSDENPIGIDIVSLGIGAPGEEDSWTGPTGSIATSQVVPEFGTIAMMILAVAIISIVAVTAKSRVVPRF